MVNIFIEKKLGVIFQNFEKKNKMQIMREVLKLALQ